MLATSRTDTRCQCPSISSEPISSSAIVKGNTVRGLLTQVNAYVTTGSIGNSATRPSQTNVCRPGIGNKPMNTPRLIERASRLGPICPPRSFNSALRRACRGDRFLRKRKLVFTMTPRPDAKRCKWLSRAVESLCVVNWTISCNFLQMPTPS